MKVDYVAGEKSYGHFALDILAEAHIFPIATGIVLHNLLYIAIINH